MGWLRLEYSACNKQESPCLVKKETCILSKIYSPCFVVFGIFFGSIVSQYLTTEEMKSIAIQHFHFSTPNLVSQACKK